MSTLIETPDIGVAAPTVVFVDLDDTLIKTDLLAEAVVKAAKNNPLGLLRTHCAACRRDGLPSNRRWLRLPPLM